MANTLAYWNFWHCLQHLSANMRGIHFITCNTCTVCPWTHLQPKNYYFETAYSGSCRKQFGKCSLSKSTQCLKPENDFPHLGNVSISCLSARPTEQSKSCLSEEPANFTDWWTISESAKSENQELHSLSWHITHRNVMEDRYRRPH